MPTRPYNITNVRFGRLVALRPVSKDRRGIRWLCQCDCGKQTIIHVVELRRRKRNNQIACGCLVGKNNYKHGHSGGGGTGRKASPEYAVWHSMRSRCRNKNDHNYKHYGARGIKVDPRWDNFETFLADVGRRPHPSLTFDRINNDGNYEPGNVRWTTKSEQNKNRRSVRIKIGLEHISTSELEAELIRRQNFKVYT